MTARSAALLGWLLVGCGQLSGRRDAGIASRIIAEDDAGFVSLCLDPPVPIGAQGPCRCHADCADGALCSEESAFGEPLGACKRRCDLDSDCRSGEVCRSRNCVGRCTSSSQCGLGRYCMADGRCLPFCQSSAECRSGNCDTYRGACVDAGVVRAGKRTDEPCLRDDECRSAICITGTCFTICAGSAQACPDGEFCFVTASASEQGWCRPRCQDNGQCIDPSTVCRDVTNAGRTARICL